MGWPGPMTHRQYVAWQAWLVADLNHPGKQEQYLMQIAAEVRRVLAKNPSRVKLDHFRLQFGGAKPAGPKSVEEATAASKARWGLMAKGVNAMTPEQLEELRRFKALQAEREGNGNRG